MKFNLKLNSLKWSAILEKISNYIHAILDEKERANEWLHKRLNEIKLI